MTFETAYNILIALEGGFVNHKFDRGGKTKFGISQRQYPDVDIKNLTTEEAEKIYYDDYWVNNRVPQLPENLRHIYFDMCVNFGRSGAVKVLQQAANSKNRNKIEVDGGLGPATLNAIQKISLDRVRAYRVLRFANIVIDKPNQEKFWLGWFRRALEV